MVERPFHVQRQVVRVGVRQASRQCSVTISSRPTPLATSPADSRRGRLKQPWTKPGEPWLISPHGAAHPARTLSWPETEHHPCCRSLALAILDPPCEDASHGTSSDRIRPRYAGSVAYLDILDSWGATPTIACSCYIRKHVKQASTA
ncbi:hypothetical protein M8818_007774 [Zalaria obscura]|uniref:Uncharacterized protein n=1 Tax=Zalaria obscura TaxID=2024903 RepID=A0ACC3S2M9_9PEZI